MTQQHTRPPFSSYPPTQSQITLAGPMSYNASMHGSAFPSTLPASPFPALADPSSLPPEPTYYDISVATHKQIATLQAKLNQKLGPEYISQRPGPGGGPKLTYAEGWKIINLANEVFGFNGWSSSICSLSVDYIDPHDEGRRWHCGVSAVVRVTLRDGVYHEDVGYGVAENIKSKGAAIDKSKKEAVTDGIKRTLRNFGNLLGNCLYDKQYTQEIVKIKVQPPKFDRAALHRRPEFEEGSSGSGSNIIGNSASVAQAATSVPANNASKARSMPPPPPPPQHKAPANLTTPVHIKAESGAPNANLQPPQTSARTNNPVPGPVPGVRHPSMPTLAHAPSTEPDESYFNSDDDALFMQLDMVGVAYEDQSIEYADATDTSVSAGVGIARVGSHDGAEWSARVGSESEPGSGRNAGPDSISNGGPGPGNAPVRGGQGQQQQRRVGQVQGQGGQQMLQQRGQAGQQPQPQHHASRQQQQQHRPQQQQQQHRPQQQQQHRPQQQQQQHRLQQHPNRSQNQQPRPPHQASRSMQASPATATHSPGSFHFPPGVDPPSRISGSPAQVAGNKRTADAMSLQGQERPHGNAPGQAQGNSNGKQRQPLAPLVVGDGGDVKRARR